MDVVGVVGCGLMGSGIARTLLREKYDVYVHDVDESSVNRLVKHGAKKTKSMKEMVKQIDVLILSLPSPQIIEQVLLEKEGNIFQAMKDSSVVIDMSTNDVKLTEELYEQAKSYNVSFMDCPLSGGPDGANSGKLTMMIGGDEETYKRLLPLLESLGEQIFYVGKSGQGQAVKLCHNMLVGGIISLLSEVVKTSESVGVSKHVLSQVLQAGTGQTRVMDVFGENILAGTFDQVKFSLSHMMKDIELYQSLAKDHAISTLSSNSIYQLFLIASHLDNGALDASAVYEVFNALESR